VELFSRKETGARLDGVSRRARRILTVSDDNLQRGPQGNENDVVMQLVWSSKL
jgi:hypothetical protein